MALTTREIFETFHYEQGVDRSSIQREYIVTGPEVALYDGPAYAVHQAPQIPDMGEKLGGSWGGRTLQVVSRVGERLGPDSCKVTVTYEYAPTEGAKRGGGSENERASLMDVPFDEQIDFTAAEVKKPIDLDGKTVGMKGEGYSAWIPSIKWTFRCNSQPVAGYWTTIGYFNDDTYPDITPPTAERPFMWSAKTLLYIGASCQRTYEEKVESTDWVWACQFTFLYNAYGWEFEDWTPTIIVPSQINWATASPPAYYKNSAGVEKQFTDIRSTKIETPLYRKVGGDKFPYYAARVREAADFTTIFPFIWT